MNETEKENTKPHADPATQEAERDTPDVRRASVHDRMAAWAAAVGTLSARVTLSAREREAIAAAVGTLSAREEMGPSLFVRIFKEAGEADQAQQSMFRDIDAILARLETGIAAERTAMDALLDRLTSKAA